MFIVRRLILLTLVERLNNYMTDEEGAKQFRPFKRSNLQKGGEGVKKKERSGVKIRGRNLWGQISLTVTVRLSKVMSGSELANFQYQDSSTQSFKV